MNRRLIPLVAGAATGVVLVVLIGWMSGFAMSELVALRLRALLAFVALALSVALVRRRRQQQLPARWIPKFVAATLAALSVGAFYNFGNPVYEGFFHRHDVFHYFIGAKYAPELGYSRIYECTARAQVELGQRKDVESRFIRNLEDDSLIQGAALLAGPNSCSPRFCPRRWQAFVADIAWFRGICEKPYWDQMQSDHGYNPTPIWTLIGRAFASLHAASWPFILSLASLDLMQYAGLFIAIGWAFGWRSVCLALLFWGCQVPASHEWVSGNFLRQDWIFFLTLSVCFLKKRKFLLAGACIACSALLRLFPAVLLLGLALIAVPWLWKHRRLPSNCLRIAIGGGCTAVALVALAVATLGTSHFTAFYDHIRVHERTPSANMMGLPMILIHDYDGQQAEAIDPKSTDPWAGWRKLRQERLRSVRPLHVALTIGVGAALVFALRRERRPWVAAPLSLLLLFAASQLSCYYCIYFILFVPLGRLDHRIEWLILGLVGVGATVATMPAFSQIPVDEYATQSALYFAFSVALLYLLASGKRAAALDSGRPHG